MASIKPYKIEPVDKRYRPCEQCGLCLITDGDDSECQHKHLPKKPETDTSE